jgi:molecular chaperone GrpE
MSHFDPGAGPADTDTDTEDLSATPQGEADLRRALEEATRKGEEYLDLLRRTRADFANYKRRTEEGRAEQAQGARSDLILKVLPVLDDFRRAVQSPPTEGAARDWAQGVLLIERKLRAILDAEGLQRIEAEGAEFNPWEHEAISYQGSPELEDGRILAVVRDGYRIGDRVIRPAQVVVARRSG